MSSAVMEPKEDPTEAEQHEKKRPARIATVGGIDNPFEQYGDQQIFDREADLNPVRDEIKDYYGIQHGIDGGEDNEIHIASTDLNQVRKVVAFVMLRDREDHSIGYYADGRTSHMILTRSIMDRMAKHAKDAPLDLMDADAMNQYEVVGGFLDPRKFRDQRIKISGEATWFERVR